MYHQLRLTLLVAGTCMLLQGCCVSSVLCMSIEEGASFCACYAQRHLLQTPPTALQTNMSSAVHACLPVVVASSASGVHACSQLCSVQRRHHTRCSATHRQKAATHLVSLSTEATATANSRACCSPSDALDVDASSAAAERAGPQRRLGRVRRGSCCWRDDDAAVDAAADAALGPALALLQQRLLLGAGRACAGTTIEPTRAELVAALDSMVAGMAADAGTREVCACATQQADVPYPTQGIR